MSWWERSTWWRSTWGTAGRVRARGLGARSGDEPGAQEGSGHGDERSRRRHAGGAHVGGGRLGAARRWGAPIERPARRASAASAVRLDSAGGARVGALRRTMETRTAIRPMWRGGPPWYLAAVTDWWRRRPPVVQDLLAGAAVAVAWFTAFHLFRQRGWSPRQPETFVVAGIWTAGVVALRRVHPAWVFAVVVVVYPLAYGGDAAERSSTCCRCWSSGTRRRARVGSTQSWRRSAAWRPTSSSSGTTQPSAPPAGRSAPVPSTGPACSSSSWRR